jgi:hypothetical protein
LVGTLGHDFCHGADHYLEAFDPSKLLNLLQSLDPEKTALILQKGEISAAPKDESGVIRWHPLAISHRLKTYSQHPLR